MHRSALLERVQLELDLLRGLRLLLLCACIFSIVVYAANIEKRSEYRLGLLVGLNTVRPAAAFLRCQSYSCKLTHIACRRIRTRAHFLWTTTILLVLHVEKKLY
jgi:hypothetical protein